MFCEVSTLPATTAAGYVGLSRLPCGRWISSGRSTPALSGMSSLMRVRKTYRTAEWAMLAGAFRLPTTCGEVPVKSIEACPRATSTRTITVIAAPPSSLTVKAPSLSRVSSRRTTVSA